MLQKSKKRHFLHICVFLLGFHIQFQKRENKLVVNIFLNPIY